MAKKKIEVPVIPPKPKKGIKFMQMGHLPYHLCISYNLTYPELVKRLKKCPNSDLWIQAFEPSKEEFVRGEKNLAFRQSVKCGDKYSQKFGIFFCEEMPTCDITHLGTISHECFHITQFVFNLISADLYEEKESAAYFHEYLFHEVASFVKEVNEKP